MQDSKPQAMSAELLEEPPATKQPLGKPSSSFKGSVFWRRGRWVALGLVLALTGHFWMKRRDATDSAGALHASATDLAACMLAERPPDPNQANFEEIVQKRLFRRLALSLQADQPLSRCDAELESFRSNINIHKENFYHRLPAQVHSLKQAAEQLSSLDLKKNALELSRAPKPPQAENTTIDLAALLAQAVDLSCRVAIAEQAFPLGACPVAPPNLSTHQVRTKIAVATQWSKPLQHLAYQASYGLLPSGNQLSLVSVMATGRDSAKQAWIAGEIQTNNPSESQAWRSLALPAGLWEPQLSPAQVASPSSLRPLRLLPSERGAFVISEPPNIRFFRTDTDFKRVSLEHQLPPPELRTGSLTQFPPSVIEGEPGVKGSRVRRSISLDMGPLSFAHISDLGDTTQVLLFNDKGLLSYNQRLEGQLLSFTTGPHELVLQQSSGPSQLTLTRYRIDGYQLSELQRIVLEGSGLLSTELEQPPQPCLEAESAQGAGEAGSKTGFGFLARALQTSEPEGVDSATKAPQKLFYIHLGRQLSATPLEIPAATNAKLICGNCSAHILLQEGGALSWLKPEQPALRKAIPTPVIFSAASAIEADATCIAPANHGPSLLIAYPASGSLLLQRGNAEGQFSAPIEISQTHDLGTPSRPSFALSSQLPALGQAAASPPIQLYWLRQGGKTRQTQLRIETAQLSQSQLVARMLP